MTGGFPVSKVRISGESAFGARIEVDGLDISNIVTDVTLRLSASRPATMEVEFLGFQEVTELAHVEVGYVAWAGGEHASGPDIPTTLRTLADRVEAAAKVSV